MRHLFLLFLAPYCFAVSLLSLSLSLSRLVLFTFCKIFYNQRIYYLSFLRFASDLFSGKQNPCAVVFIIWHSNLIFILWNSVNSMFSYVWRVRLQDFLIGYFLHSCRINEKITISFILHDFTYFYILKVARIS